MKLESRNSGEMKRVCEFDDYKLAEALSDIKINIQNALVVA